MLIASDGEAFSIALFEMSFGWLRHVLVTIFAGKVKEKSRNMMMLCGMKVGRQAGYTMQALFMLWKYSVLSSTTAMRTEKFEPPQALPHVQ